jgi:hypothetical protein
MGHTQHAKVDKSVMQQLTRKNEKNGEKASDKQRNIKI